MQDQFRDMLARRRWRPCGMAAHNPACGPTCKGLPRRDDGGSGQSLSAERPAPVATSAMLDMPSLEDLMELARRNQAMFAGR